MPDFRVYILQSQKSGRYYTGMTNDIDRRLRQHNEGLNKFTRNKGPWRMIWSLKGITKDEAQTLERSIKKRGAGRYLAELS